MMAGAMAAPAVLAGGTGALAAPPRAATAGGTATPPGCVAHTSGGRVRGYARDGISIFKGVPYGAPTGGQARFMPPRAVAPWAGTRLCMTPGPICPQPEEGHGPSPMAFLTQSRPAPQSEDCLSLNIWTPADMGAAPDGKKRPVMVWIHGGEFTTGSSIALPATDGEALARRGDVVVVSVNHRLNLLGYLDLAALGAPAEFASAGNVGMLDLVLALEWVRDNIAGFGGDAGNVTIFGQSGGGLKVTTLCAMPAARGLFHKAIVQSGSESRVFTREMTRPLASALLAELGVAPGDAAQLQAMPLARLMAAGDAVLGRWVAQAHGDVWHMVGWAPVVDGSIIPASPYEPASRALSGHIPLLVGSVRHEFCMTMFSLEAEHMTMDQARAALAVNFRDAGGLLDAFARAYPREKPVGLMAMISAASFNRWNAVHQAQDQAAAGQAPAFLYRFDWITPMLDGSPRAYHCAELPMVFHSIDHVPEAAGTSQRSRTMAGRMADAWIAFARSGQPGHAGLPHWPPVTPGHAPAMLFDDICQVDDFTDKGLLDLVRAARKWA